MKTAVRTVLTLMVAAMLVAPLAAADEKGKKKKGKGKNQAARQSQNLVNGAFKLPKEIVLTDEQKAKVAALKKELGPKLIEVSKKVNGIFSAEQRKAATAARKAATAAGKKGKELRAAVAAARKLTDEQKKQYAAAQKAAQAVRQGIRGKLTALLTADQKAKLPKRKGKGNAKKKKKSDNT